MDTPLKANKSPTEMGHYILKKTLHRHYDSINTLAFSHNNGSLFASSSDDGLVIIFQGYGSGKEIC